MANMAAPVEVHTPLMKDKAYNNYTGSNDFKQNDPYGNPY